MVDTFKIGEVAILIRAGSPHYGMECEVVEGLAWRGGGYDHTTGGKSDYGIKYCISINGINGKMFVAKPEWLRKKQQKRDIDQDIDQLVSWDDFQKATGWAPKRQTA